MKRLLFGAAKIMILLALLPGCSPTATSYIRQDVDYSFIRRVAVLPFQNLSQDVNANERVYSIFVAQLLERQVVEVAEYGAVLSGMGQMQLNVESVLTPEQFTELGKILGVDGIFYGAIEEYGLERISNARTYTLTATYSLAETQTGSTIWNAQARTDGTSFWRKLFGGGSASLYSVSRSNVERALGTLF
jgi:hypothetical protein